MLLIEDSLFCGKTLSETHCFVIPNWKITIFEPLHIVSIHSDFLHTLPYNSAIVSTLISLGNFNSSLYDSQKIISLTWIAITKYAKHNTTRISFIISIWYQSDFDVFWSVALLKKTSPEIWLLYINIELSHFKNSSFERGYSKNDPNFTDHMLINWSKTFLFWYSFLKEQ